MQIQRPESLKSKNKGEIGGLSGRPLKAMATQCVSDMYKLTKGQVAIIAVRSNKGFFSPVTLYEGLMLHPTRV